MAGAIAERGGADLRRRSGPPHHPEVLDRLDQLSWRATFFCLGEQVVAHPELVGEIRRRGHQVETHGFRHEHHFVRSPRWVREDLDSAVDAMEEVGVRPRWFRPPFGQTTGATMVEARRHDLRLVLWSAWGREWDEPDASSVARRVRAGIGPGGIVLLHDADVQSPPGSSRRAAEALGPIAEDLHRQGLAALTLDELVGAVPMTVKRALFLSGKFGAGHDTLAEACAAALLPYGVESRIVDCMPMLGGGPSAVGNFVFRSLLSITPVYDGFHFSQLRGNGSVGRIMDRAAVKVMLPRLIEELTRYSPDLVVSVFATGASAAVHLKHTRPDLATVVFMTDSFAHGMWVHQGTDLFLVTSELAAASVRRYYAEARVSVVEAPVRPDFYTAPSQADARRLAQGSRR